MKDTVEKIMREKGAVKYTKRADNWNGYAVYDPIFNRPAGCYGLPEYVLEDRDGNARRVTPEEALEVMDFLIKKTGSA